MNSNLNRCCSSAFERGRAWFASFEIPFERGRAWFASFEIPAVGPLRLIDVRKIIRPHCFCFSFSVAAMVNILQEKRFASEHQKHGDLLCTALFPDDFYAKSYLCLLVSSSLMNILAAVVCYMYWLNVMSAVLFAGNALGLLFLLASFMYELIKPVTVTEEWLETEEFGKFNRECPVCLEDFKQPEVNNLVRKIIQSNGKNYTIKRLDIFYPGINQPRTFATFGFSNKQVVSVCTLQCKHHLCAQCLGSMLLFDKRSNKRSVCPLDRKPLDSLEQFVSDPLVL